MSAIERALHLALDTDRMIVNVVLSQMNRVDALDLPEWMGKHGIGVINPIPMKHATMALPKAELRGLLISLLNSAAAAHIGVFVEGPSGGVLSPQQAIQLLMGKRPAGCAMGCSTVFVEVDGTCYPCNSSSRRFQQLCLGNAFEAGITRVWESRRARRVRSQLSQAIPRDCAGLCDYSNVLRNSCVAEAAMPGCIRPPANSLE